MTTTPSPAFLKLRQLLPWTLPLKLALSATLGVLGSAGLLGYLSEYATYSYAIYYGMRPPLEGIPYLKAAVALGSLFLLLSGAAVFAITFSLLRSFVWYMDGVPTIAARIFSILWRRPVPPATDLHSLYGSLLHRLRGVSHLRVAFHCALLAFIVTTIVVLIAWFDRASGTRSLEQFLGLGLAMFCYIFVLSLAVLRPRAIWWIGGTSVLGYLVACIILLFSPTHYSRFLRVVGYGGGIPVTLELKEDSPPTSQSRTAKEDYYLMLRTSESFVLLHSSSSQFVEVPREQVRRLLHRTGGLHQLPFQLPRSNASSAS